MSKKQPKTLETWKIYIPIHISVFLFSFITDWVISITTNTSMEIAETIVIGNALGWIFGMIGILVFYENPRRKIEAKKTERLSKKILDTYSTTELKRLYNEDFKKLKSEYGFTPTMRELETIIVYKCDAISNSPKYTIEDMVDAYKKGYLSKERGYNMFFDSDPKEYIQGIYDPLEEIE